MSQHPRFGPSPDLSQNVSIVILDIDHINEVRSLQKTTFRRLCANWVSEAEADAFYAYLDSPAFSSDLFNCMKSKRVLGARLDRRLVAVASWDLSKDNPRTGRLRSIFVDTMFTHAGIGRALLNELERRAANIDMKTMSVRVLGRSVGFFEKLGYATTGQGVYNLTDEEGLAVVYLRRSLDPKAGYDGQPQPIDLRL